MWYLSGTVLPIDEWRISSLPCLQNPGQSRNRKEIYSAVTNRQVFFFRGCLYVDWLASVSIVESGIG